MLGWYILHSRLIIYSMLMYLELSRPAGDVSRWEKVLKRLTLLNKHYPLRGKACVRMKKFKDFFNMEQKNTLIRKVAKRKNRTRTPDNYDDEEEYLTNIETRLYFVTVKKYVN